MTTKLELDTEWFAGIKAKISELNESVKKNAQAELSKVFRQFAEQVPDIKGIIWVQYTPFFNDGDACEFSVNDPTFLVVAPEEGRGEYDYEDEEKVQYGSAIDKLCDQFWAAIRQDEIFEAAFGDHAQITFDAETGNFEVAEYEHE